MRNKKLIVVLIVVCSITLLVVLNSVIFSVQNVTTYCFNAPYDEAFSNEIIQKSGIKKGGSIFTLDKDKVTYTLTSGVPDIKIINIEKKFPNTVSINFVKVFEYLRIEQNGKYYCCSNDGRILRILDSIENEDKLIELRVGPIKEVNEGDKFASDSSSEVAITTELLSALERLDVYREAVELIDFIDIRKSQFVFVKMHSGVMLELQGTGNITMKLRMALTVFDNKYEWRNSGTIIVPDGDGERASWSPESRYDKIMGKL
jgi:Cell division septal protein